MPSNTFPLWGGAEGEVPLACCVCGSGVLLSTLQHLEQFLQPEVICSDGNSSELEELCLAGWHVKKNRIYQNLIAKKDGGGFLITW